jgi:hypothetical protein
MISSGVNIGELILVNIRKIKFSRSTNIKIPENIPGHYSKKMSYSSFPFKSIELVNAIPKTPYFSTIT